MEAIRRNSISAYFVVALMVLFSACDQEGPLPEGDGEVITTVDLTLLPNGGGAPVTLKYFDQDGLPGTTAPLITVSGKLKSFSRYQAVIGLRNENVTPAKDITEEIGAEAETHLFCFTTTENISIQYNDEDANGSPIGLLTSWETGSPGSAKVTLALRHQERGKNGDCPGPGQSDVEADFDLQVE